jgi:4-amino-4-deoxy-L-arabinose transferase-like glycosyltransferase
MEADASTGSREQDGTGERPPAKGWFARWQTGWLPWALVAGLGLLLTLPRLGSTGLWDPWEPHYAEVAREMVVSGDWLVPTWEHSPGMSTDRKHFFSKPALAIWLMAAGMQVFGVHDPKGGIRPGLEWVLRLPFALLAVLGLLATFGLARRFFGAEVGLLAAGILATCPQYYFIARQAMTDMPLVALVTCGIALLILGGFDRDQPRAGLLYGGYACLGLAVLAKGLSGFALPGLIFLLYFLLSGDWARLGRMRVITGGALALLVAAPWFVYLSIVSALRGLVDDEGKTFFQRFFLHDHLYRLASGVHGDRGTFAYFIKQLGLGCHPWFPFMVWGGIRSAWRLDREARQDRAGRVELLLVLWALGAFGLYSLSVTKFHHYALPAVPAMAILAALWLTRWRAGQEQLGGKLLPLGLVLMVVLISRDIGLLPQSLTELFVYNYTRAFPKEEAVIGQVGFSVLFGLTALGLSALYLAGRDWLRRQALVVLLAGALASAVWGGWYFFPAMGAHWSQRHLFDTYYALRGPDEPIGAYMMNWRGETFYSRNSVSQLKNNTGLQTWLKRHHKRRMFLLVEQHRLTKLKGQLPVELRSHVRVLDRTCNKFYLISVQERPDEPAS